MPWDLQWYLFVGEEKSSGNRNRISYKILKAFCSLYSVVVAGAIHFILNITIQGRYRLSEETSGEICSMRASSALMGPASLGRLQLQEHPQLIFQLKIRVIYFLFFKSLFYLIAEKLRDLFMPRE